MILMALSIGFFGSLHCMGMCGPLALGISNFAPNSPWQAIIHALKYNIGRVVSYALIGIIIGSIGELMSLVSLQKVISIASGVLLIILLIFSLDLESFLMKSKRFLLFYQKSFTRISSKLIGMAKEKPFRLGMANGILPCGLVYLAVAGSISMGSFLGGVSFMLLFGIATIPTMLLIMFAGKQLLFKRIPIFKRIILPGMQLILGIYLISRGLGVDFPSTLDFQLALKNPIMCY